MCLDANLRSLVQLIRLSSLSINKTIKASHLDHRAEALKGIVTLTRPTIAVRTIAPFQRFRYGHPKMVRHEIQR